MLNKDARNWQYFISWDNPVPKDSSKMLKALGKLGKVTPLQTKTTVARAPRPKTKWPHVRSAIEENLHDKKGNAIYVNVRSGKGFQYGRKTNWKWKSPK